jgi:hypothetical protein
MDKSVCSYQIPLYFNETQIEIGTLKMYRTASSFYSIKLQKSLK